MRRSSSPNTPSSDSSPSSSEIPLAVPIAPDTKEYDEGLFRAYLNDSAFDPGYEVVLPNARYQEPVEDETKDVQVVRPPKENCVGLPIRVRNVPLCGAKSRVETQLKVTIDLVWDPNRRRAPTSPIDKEDSAPTVGSWEWLSLPPGSATKRRGRKDAKIAPTPAQTLSLHTMVHVASPPHTAARACKKCLAREAKRAERKRRGPNDPSPTDLPDLGSLGCEDDKIVLYNCADVLDFRNGTVDLPVRLTCYCRHHSEKLGFRITFILRDHTGRTVGTGVTPPIMITDDHKSTARKVQAQQSAGPGLVPPTAVASGNNLVSAPAGSAANGARRNSKDKGSKHRMKPYDRSRASSIGLLGGVKEEAGVVHGASNYATPSTQGYTSPPPQSPTLFTGMFGMQAVPRLQDPQALLSPARSAFLSPPRSPITSRTHTRAHSPVQIIPPPSSNHAPSPTHTMHSPTHTTIHSPIHTTVHSRAHSPVRGILSPQTSVHSLPVNDMLMESLLGGGDALLGVNGDPLLGMGDDALMAGAFGSANCQMFDPSFDPTIPGGDPSGTDWETMLQELSAQPSQSAKPPSQGAMYVEHPAWDSAPNAAWTTEPATCWAPDGMDLSPPETAPIPRVSRVVPNSGPIQGGIEVTLLGENFTRAYECKFGEHVATETALWGGNTLVCLLPPAAQPGAVPVCIKGYENVRRPGEREVLFTYKDDSVDRSLMELALRVVGQRMTGRQEEPCNIARRIVAVGEMQPNSSSVPVTRLAQSVIESDAPPPRLQDELVQFLTLLDVPDGVGSRAVSTSEAVSLQNETGHTLLHLSAVLGFDKLTTDLIARGADPDVRDATGQTPLHLAALRAQAGCVQVLLGGGADREIVNACGMAPVDVARERGYTEILTLLEAEEEETTEEEEDIADGLGLQALTLDDSADGDADESDLGGDDSESTGEQSSSRDEAIDGLYAEPSVGGAPASPSSYMPDLPAGDKVVPVPLTWFHRTFSHLQPQKAWPLPQINLPDIPALPAWPVTIPWPQTPEKGTFDLGAFRGFLGARQEQQVNQAGLTMYPPPAGGAGEPTMQTQGLNQAQLRARLARRLGYYPTEVTDREIRAYTHHSQKMRRLKKDRMLVLFWLPILLFVIAWGLYQSVPMAFKAMASNFKGMLPLTN